MPHLEKYVFVFNSVDDVTNIVSSTSFGEPQYYNSSLICPLFGLGLEGDRIFFGGEREDPHMLLSIMSLFQLPLKFLQVFS